ncbi:MAG: 23S rRNA (guanosine(2251)-2'-O)-methyltransferase RlmB [Betaproteobacteria bacterium]|nr:23S rRNA (guanosine(2251)-2'-O)-methyltransferase RlmB [Betaproteobacteria bacterium]
MKSQTLFGIHAVSARIRMKPETVHEIFVDQSRRDHRMNKVLEIAKEKNLRVMGVSGERLDGMTGHARHQGIAANVEPARLPQFIDDVLDTLEVPPFLLVLDGVTDPHNLGACLRVADAAGCHAVIAPKDRSVGLTATAMKVASGAAESMPYIVVTNLARTLLQLKERNVWIVGADEGGTTPLFSAKLTGPLAWVLGAEGEGLRRLTRERCDEIVSIPMFGSVESLNVSVASGVCLFEARRQREMSGK